MGAVAAAFALVYAVVDVFSAWAVGRRRRRLGMGFMAGAALLAVAAVAAAFGHPAALPLAGAGVAVSWAVALAEDRRARSPNEWLMPRVLRLLAGAAILAAFVVARGLSA